MTKKLVDIIDEVFDEVYFTMMIEDGGLIMFCYELNAVKALHKILSILDKDSKFISTDTEEYTVLVDSCLTDVVLEMYPALSPEGRIKAVEEWLKNEYCGGKDESLCR